MRLLLILDKGATTPYTLYGEKSLSPGRVLWRSCRLQAGTYSSPPHSSWLSSEMADATGLLPITVVITLTGQEPGNEHTSTPQRVRQHGHPAGNGQFLRGEKSSGGNGLFRLGGYRGGQPYYRLAPRVMTRWFPGGNESICSPASLSNKEPGLSREKQERKGPSCATCLETAERLRMIY
jgi:hypothetical protein